mmetsp:Transcript_20602/g.48420  ORF Transcript_20602/g.48420 Transcript_20602/m.48420 type:complete len:84 (+) Transcript_20602:1631-1882(+)
MHAYIPTFLDIHTGSDGGLAEKWNVPATIGASETTEEKKRKRIEKNRNGTERNEKATEKSNPNIDCNIEYTGNKIIYIYYIYK